MENRYLLVLRYKDLDGRLCGSVYSASNKEEHIYSVIHKLFFDYYRKSLFCIKDTVEKKAFEIWISKELGIMKKEVEYDSLPEAEGMQHQDGSGCLGEAKENS